MLILNIVFNKGIEMKQIFLTFYILLSTTSLYAGAGCYICKTKNGDSIMTYKPQSSYTDCVWHSKLVNTHSEAIDRPDSVTIEKHNFKPNKALSDYLDDQGYKVGISRTEAISYYKFDKTGITSAADKYWRSDITDIDGYPMKVGFYEGIFHNDQRQLTNSLYGIKKCIAIETESLNKSAIGEAFLITYGINYQSEQYLYHHGRYIVFNLQFIELQKDILGRKFAGSAVVISLQDSTEKFLEETNSKKCVDNATERIKKQLSIE
jgi:hypothetical protein